MKKSKILTVAIPTYNRSPFLQQSLVRIISQIKGHEDEIEILVSDNCSTDNTQQIVKKFIESGTPIICNLNRKNIGADGNFIYCFKNATAKYVWILGDDDYLVDGTIPKLLSIMKAGEYGLIHLSNNKFSNNLDNKIFTSKSLFLEEVSYWITFISSNIVKTKIVSTVNFNKYKDTYLSYIVGYITAAIIENQNLIINFKVLEDPADGSTNGGYNIFEVFVMNYLNIIREYRPVLGLKWYEVEKYRLLRGFIYGWMTTLLINPNHGLRFKTDNWLKIIINKYWYEPYLYPMLFLFSIKKLRSSNK